jgi:hypothetical protein
VAHVQVPAAAAAGDAANRASTTTTRPWYNRYLSLNTSLHELLFANIVLLGYCLLVQIWGTDIKIKVIMQRFRAFFDGYTDVDASTRQFS